MAFSILENRWVQTSVLSLFFVTPVIYLLWRKNKRNFKEKITFDKEREQVLEEILKRQNSEKDIGTQQNNSESLISIPKYEDSYKLNQEQPPLEDVKSLRTKYFEHAHVNSSNQEAGKESKANFAKSSRQALISRESHVVAIPKNLAFHLNELTPPEHKQSEQQQWQVLREEQDADFLRSLEEDQLKEAILASYEEETKKQAALEMELKEQLEREIQERKRHLDLKRANLKAEPKEGQPSCSLVFRLHTGSKIQRTFRPDDFLSDVFDFLETHEELFDGGWKLMTIYPKQELSSQINGHTTLKLLNLCPKSVLLVCKEEY